MPENPTTNAEPSGFFANLNWQTYVIVSILSILVGGATGGGVALSRPEAPKGLSQDAADVRYLSKEEADRRRTKLEADSDRREKDIKDGMKEIHDEQLRQRDKLDKIVEKVYSK